MELRAISENLSVSPQICVADIDGIVAAGFRALICNRPDNEDPGQPAYAEIETAARAAGLRCVHQPVASGGMCEQDALDFAAVLKDLPMPVLAYCRSGTRCSMLWDVARRLDPDATGGAG